MSKLGQLVKWNRLGASLSRLKGALSKESNMDGYDWKIGARKALEGILHGLLAVLVVASLAYFSDPAALTVALHHAGISDAVIALAVPLIVGGAKLGSNWAKNKDKPVLPTGYAPSALPPTTPYPQPTGYAQSATERDDR